MEMEIYKKIPEIMSELGVIPKDQTNKKQGWKFRGVDDVMNALQPILYQHGVFIVPEVLDQYREERKASGGGNLIYSILKMRYTFYASDGSSVTAVVIGEGMDSGDKASNKAMSVAYKYACFQVFSIPTEEMRDPDVDTQPESTPKEYLCEECGKPFEPFTGKNGVKYTAAQAYHIAESKRGKAICRDCHEKTKAAEIADSLSVIEEL